MSETLLIFVQRGLLPWSLLQCWYVSLGHCVPNQINNCPRHDRPCSLVIIIII